MDKESLVLVVKRSQAGESAAQETLIREVQQSIYYQCLKFLHHPEDAQDATQDVLIQMLTKLHTLNQPEAFWGWINCMTANHCKNILRKTGELQIPEDEEGNSLLDTFETMDEQTVPDKALDNEETRRMIIEMIDALPTPQRMCVIMYYYNEMSVKDIASTLEVSENTVKSRLNYARKAIKEGTEKYERQGIKLYGLSPLPFLLHFLRKDADVSLLGADLCQSMTDSVLATTLNNATIASEAAAPISEGVASSFGGAETAASVVGNAATKGAVISAIKGSALTTKIVAGVLSAAVVLGGGGVLLSAMDEKSDSPAEQAPVFSTEPQYGSEATQPSEESQAPHIFLQILDTYENACYAELVDLDVDGTDELILGIRDTTDDSICLVAFTSDASTLMEVVGSTMHTVASEPADWNIAYYRHVDTKKCYLGLYHAYWSNQFLPYDTFSYTFSSLDEIIWLCVNPDSNGPEYDFLTFEPDAVTTPPPSSYINLTKEEHESRLAKFELIRTLPFDSNTTDYSQFSHTIQEVRQQLENTEV